MSDQDTAYANAMDRAVKMLAARPRSAAEVTQRLEKQGFPGEAIQAAVQRLIDLEVIDDGRLALDEARRAVEERPASSDAVRDALRRRGVDDEVIEAAIDEAGTGDDAALDAARRKARTYASLPWPVASRRLLAFLARRGFSYEVAAPACRAALEEAGVAVTD